MNLGLFTAPVVAFQKDKDLDYAVSSPLRW